MVKSQKKMAFGQSRKKSTEFKFKIGKKTLNTNSNLGKNTKGRGKLFKKYERDFYDGNMILAYTCVHLKKYKFFEIKCIF